LRGDVNVRMTKRVRHYVGASAVSGEQTVTHAMPDTTMVASCKFRRAADRVVLGAAVRAEVREAAAGELAVPEAEVPGSADRPVLDREAAAPGPADHPVLDREVAAPVPSVPELSWSRHDPPGQWR